MAATLFVQPLDLIKNRMQMAGEGGTGKRLSSPQMLKKIVSEEGARFRFGNEK